MTKRTEKHPLMLAICLAWIWLPGCMMPEKWITGKAEPRFELDVNPFTGRARIKDETNGRFEADEITLRKGDTEVTMKGVKRDQDTATVKRADAVQLEQVNRAHETQVTWQAQVGDNIEKIVDTAMTGAVASLKAAAPGGLKGLGTERMDPFYYVALGVAAGLYLWSKRRAPG